MVFKFKSIIKISNTYKLLNQKFKKNNFSYVDPLDLSKLKIFKVYFYSENNFRAFPIINDIKIFNNDTQLFLPSLKLKK
jgi:hypothetical protein